MLLLSILFLIILILILFICKKNILNPSIIMCSVFLISFIFYYIKQKEWEQIIFFNTILTIFLTIIFFLIGVFIGEILVKNKETKNNKILILKKSISYWKLYLIIIFLIFVIYFYFLETYRLSLISGNTEGYSKMLYYARNTILNKTGRINYFLSLNIFIVKAIIYILIFFISKKFILRKFIKKDFLFFIPIFLYINIIILTTGRTEFIYLIVYTLNIYFILYLQRYNYKIKRNLKVIFFGITSLMTFFIFFTLAGYLTGKSQSLPIIDMISLYTGSSIPALNYFINFNNQENLFWGAHTLALLYKFLLKIGYKVPQLYGPCEIIEIGTIRTNVYTAIKRYIEDYNFSGLFIIVLILGVFYGILFYRAYYRKNKDLSLIYYATFCYPIYEFSIEERFLTTIISTGTIYNIIFIYFFYYLLFNRKGAL